ncbi:MULTISPECIES: caspase family protein [unclassified Marinovum]
MLRLLIVLWVCGMSATLATAETRVALVIGNSDYANTPRLVNPMNDARALTDKLKGMGFEVMAHENLDGQGMRRALGAFTEAALRADLALVFYAGHGIEMSGRNYLIPVDAEMRSEATAQFEALALDDVISAVRLAGSLGIVMLDACRDNPFASKMQRNSGTRSLSRGLAPVNVEGEQGLVVSFAAQEGSTAADGDGTNSPYTAALLKVIDEPGLEVGRLFRRVRAQVRETTKGQQVPVERMQLPDKAIYFVPDGAAPEAQPVVQPVAPPRGPVARDPMVIYLEAVASGELEPLNDFVSRYPDHPRTKDARNLIAMLQDDAFWAQIVAEDTVQAYRRYLIAFSDGQYVDRASERIAALTEPPKATAPVVTQPVVTQPVVSQPVVTQPAAPSTRGDVSPSFDCGRATTSVERAICSSAGLAQQDNDLLAAYQTARNNGWVSQSNQRSWVQQRGAACNGVGWQVVDCVGTISGDRINGLRAGRLSGNISPGFNCAKAGTNVERAICGSDVLGRQDHLLLTLYKSAKSRNTSAARSQGDWIRQRETQCGRQSDVALCVAKTTADRMSALAR